MRERLHSKTCLIAAVMLVLSAIAGSAQPGADGSTTGIVPAATLQQVSQTKPGAATAPQATVPAKATPAAPAQQPTPSAAPAPAQKKALSYDAYDGWRSIQGTKISRDGTWLVYALVPQDGDGELVVRNLKTSAEHREPRGREPVITWDGKFVVYAVAPVKADVDKAKKDKKKPEDMPKSGMGVLELASMKATTIDRVKSFKVPEESGGFVACLLEKPEPKPGEKPEAKPEATPEEKKDTAKKKEKKKEPGTALILRELATGTQSSIEEVTEYAWAKNGAWLAHAVSSTTKTPEKDGVFARRPGEATSTALLTGNGNYKGLAFDDKGTQLAFVSDRDDYKADAPAFKLYLWRAEPGGAGGPAAELASATTPGMPAGMTVSEFGTLEFSKDGERLFLGTAPAPKADPEDAPEPAKVDLWHWKDPFLQPMQKVRAEEEKKRNYRAVMHLKDRRFVQLASPEVPAVTLSEDATKALALSDVPYRQLVSWDSRYDDLYAVNLQDGSRRKLVQQIRSTPSLSPGGTYALFFDYKDNNWYSVRLADGTLTNLTGRLGVHFEDESNDTPEPPRAHGSAGWTEGDRSVLLYDQFDVWEVQPDGTNARLVTNGFGRKTHLVLRHVRLDPAERRVGHPGVVGGLNAPIKTDRPLLLSATDDVTKATGYYRVPYSQAPGLKPGGSTAPAEPSKIVMLDKGFGGLQKADAADTLVFTLSRFEEFPNLWVSDTNFVNMRKVSDANPKQAEYRWGRSEIIDYINADGRPLRALLTRPDDFDASKKYPMMVYIYEKLTDGFHRYHPPGPGSSSINVTRYVSNGYIVLQPDIVYNTGYPGEDAFKCVVPAVQKVLGMGFVDPKRVGIQGHSWGGYQITYLITRTDMFRAVEAGASVTNMVSAYGGIRWGSGMSRAFQYEKSQSRIGAPPWKAPLQFIENSPIFWVEKVKTPYLTMHNDEDDAVPWYQGIEFFNALRRLGKEAYMFVYNGEKHGLRDRENQKHWTVHMDEFFDYYLKGAPKPAWMESGVPYLERGTRDVNPLYKPKTAEQKKTDTPQ